MSLRPRREIIVRPAGGGGLGVPDVTVPVITCNQTDDLQPNTVIPNGATLAGFIASGQNVYGWARFDDGPYSPHSIYVAADAYAGMANLTDGNGPVDVSGDFYLVTADWDPLTLTWNNQPSAIVQRRRISGTLYGGAASAAQFQYAALYWEGDIDVPIYGIMARHGAGSLSADVLSIGAGWGVAQPVYLLARA